MMLYDSFAAWINSFLACMGGCLGNCTKPTGSCTVDELSKGQQGLTLEKSSRSEDFWTTSTYDIDTSVGLSRRSISSLSTSNQSFCCDVGSGNTHSEFVNHGLLLWNQMRGQWTGGRTHAVGSAEAAQSRIRFALNTAFFPFSLLSHSVGVFLLPNLIPLPGYFRKSSASETKTTRFTSC
ncbi:hypothetical protein Ancab_006874 [Ancistrocladus abbreviatus]